MKLFLHLAHPCPFLLQTRNKKSHKSWKRRKIRVSGAKKGFHIVCACSSSSTPHDQYFNQAMTSIREPSKEGGLVSIIPATYEHSTSISCLFIKVISIDISVFLAEAWLGVLPTYPRYVVYVLRSSRQYIHGSNITLNEIHGYRHHHHHIQQLISSTSSLVKRHHKS